jgi:hypothetical protein
MELYINDRWTACYGNSHIAEAIAWSETGNHASIYATGGTAEEANTRLLNALRELKLVSQEAAKDQR